MDRHLAFPDLDDIEAWEVYLWNLPDDFLSRPQKLQFMLIAGKDFNAFESIPVLRDLLKHRALWDGVVMDRGFLDPRIGSGFLTWLCTDLIKLRDIAGGYWNVDTLFILAPEANMAPLQKLTENWHADETDVIAGEQADGLLGVGRSAHPQRILTVWWD